MTTQLELINIIILSRSLAHSSCDTLYINYQLLCTEYYLFPSRMCLHFEVVGGLELSNDPESYAGGSVATGRASLAGKVKGDDPD